MASAAEAFAGVFGFLSPVMGPAAAGPAAAAEATVSGVGDAISAAGGYDVPPGVSGLMRYHEREMMLPAPLAERIRNMTGQDGGGPGGGAMHIERPHFHFHGDHWEEGIKRNPRILYKAIKDGIRDAQLRFR